MLKGPHLVNVQVMTRHNLTLTKAVINKLILLYSVAECFLPFASLFTAKKQKKTKNTLHS